MVAVDTPPGTELVVVESVRTLERMLELVRPDQHATLRRFFETSGGLADHPELAVGARVRLRAVTPSQWFWSRRGLVLEGYPGEVFPMEGFATVDGATP